MLHLLHEAKPSEDSHQGRGVLPALADDLTTHVSRADEGRSVVTLSVDKVRHATFKNDIAQPLGHDLDTGAGAPRNDYGAHDCCLLSVRVQACA